MGYKKEQEISKKKKGSRKELYEEIMGLVR